MTAACSSEDAPAIDGPTDTENEAYLGLTTPEVGFQVRNAGSTIESGADVEFCEVAELPGDPSETYYVGAAEFGNADFSHHLIVSAAVPGSPADAALRAVEVGHQVPCLSAELAFGQDGMIGVGGTQGRNTRIDYPDGVGREYHGGQRIVFDYHYYNTSDSPVDARSVMNLHLREAADVTQLASSFSFTNWLIDTPPGTQSSFTAECRFRDDVRVSGLTRHTHRWGTDYSVWFAGGTRDGEHIFTSNDFQHDVDHRFDDAILMRAGEGFRFQCDFDNTEDRPLRFGINATDEMCILFGLYWDGGDARVPPNQDCNVVYADEGGVGRPVGEEGFPAPPQDQVDLCTTGAAGDTGEADACITCQCESCATVLIQCAVDPDCSEILACVQERPVEECQSTIDEHSTALGMLQQVAGCMQASGCGPLCDP
jgi:hypothetical protein